MDFVDIYRMVQAMQVLCWNLRDSPGNNVLLIFTGWSGQGRYYVGVYGIVRVIQVLCWYLHDSPGNTGIMLVFTG